MARGPAEIDQVAEPAQVERRDHVRRADAGRSRASPSGTRAVPRRCGRSCEKIGPSQPNACCQRCVPSRTASSRFAPQLPQHVVRVLNVAGQPAGAGARQDTPPPRAYWRTGRRVSREPQADAGVEQSLQGSRVVGSSAASSGQSGAADEGIEDAQRNGARTWSGSGERPRAGRGPSTGRARIVFRHDHSVTSSSPGTRRRGTGCRAGRRRLRGDTGRRRRAGACGAGPRGSGR